MADPIWPTAPWHLLIIDWVEPGRGFLIEHTHRILGYLAGAMILVQTVWFGFTAPTALRRCTQRDPSPTKRRGPKGRDPSMTDTSWQNLLTPL